MKFNVVTDLKNEFHPCPKVLNKKGKVSKQIKQKSSKLTKKEKERFSILQDESKCFICFTREGLTLHEAFGGCRRQKSMDWGLVYYLCGRCHTIVEHNEILKELLKIYARREFNTKYEEDLFLKEFGRNYL